MTTNVETAAAILGSGRTLADELAESGRLRVRLLRLGDGSAVPVADQLTYLASRVGLQRAVTSENATRSRTDRG